MQTLSREKLRKRLSYEKTTRKMLVKLTIRGRGDFCWQPAKGLKLNKDINSVFVILFENFETKTEFQLCLTNNREEVEPIL